MPSPAARWRWRWKKRRLVGELGGYIAAVPLVFVDSQEAGITLNVLKSTDELLICGKWLARPDWDDLFQMLEIRPDGTGRVMSGGGQVVSLIADLRYSLRANHLILSFQDTRDITTKPFVVTPSNAVLELEFEIRRHPSVLFVPAVGGSTTFSRCLELSDSPLPVNASDYHRDNLFFHGINHVDPRGFKEFLST